MSAQKHRLDDASSTRKSKKLRVSNAKAEREQKPVQASPVLIPDEVNFPRGGGTTFTPLEVQALRTEAVKEANQELFKVRVLSYPCEHLST
jgi:rRNA biogenesis protein RRP5